MGRTYKKYYLKSVNKHLTINELSEISGLDKHVIYDRIHRYKWDVDSAVRIPKHGRINKTNINNISTSNNIIRVDNMNIQDNMINSFFNKNNVNLIQPDYVGYDINNIFYIIKFVDCNNMYGQEGKITPFKSHPNRYPKRWSLFVPLIDIAKSMNGYLYIINYDSNEDKEYRILKVNGYKLDQISNYLKFDLKYCEYLNIIEDLKLDKNGFYNWLNYINEISKQRKNNRYKQLNQSVKFHNNNKLFNIPPYFKEPIKSKDHLGNVYYSFNEMCRNYNMNATTVKQRLEKGWSIEEALTIQSRQKEHKLDGRE